MDPTLKIAADQLGRMRGMTRYYHERFFSDIRLQVVLTVALFVIGFWEVEGAFLLIPVVALYGAVQTAFDASTSSSPANTPPGWRGTSISASTTPSWWLPSWKRATCSPSMT